MKNILLIATILLSSCHGVINEPCQPEAEFNLSVKLVDGSWNDVSYTVPKDTEFFIRGSSGSYFLCANNSCGEEYLRAAVIDFKVLPDSTNKKADIPR